MSEKNSQKSYPRNRTDSLIGAGVRIDGDIRFNGVLRVMGEVLGDVTCPADPQGTIVVESAAVVIGAIKAPHVIVSGRVVGPLSSSVSIEIRQGGECSGGASYKELDVRQGGFIDGLLTPSTLLDNHRTRAGDPASLPGAQSVARYVPSPPAVLPGSVRRPSGRNVAVTILVLAVVLAAFTWARNAPPVAAPAVTFAPPVDTAASSPAPLPPAAVVEPMVQALPKTAEAPAVLPAALPPARKEPAAIPANMPGADSTKVVTVQGLNPEKPASHIFVITNEPSVLLKRRRGDASDGTRIEISKDKNIRVPVSRDEQFRVVVGRDVSIFYQGRKVPPHNIESGVWLSFVPLQTGAGGDNP